MQFVEVRLSHGYGRIGRRERFSERLSVEGCHALARFDVITFIEVHLRHTAGLTEGQLNLPDVDIAVQAQCVVAVAATLHPQPSSTNYRNDGGNNDGPLCSAG